MTNLQFERYEHPEERVHQRMRCSVAAAVVGGGALLSAGTSIFAGNEQANAVTNATNQANSIEQQQFAQTQANEAPYLSAGKTALNTITNDQATGTGFAAPFTMSNFYSDPGYQFTLNQGNQAVQRSAAAQGGLLSGAAAKAMDQYTTGLANQTYGDAYNRYLQTSQQQYNQLSGIANLGQNATSTQAQLGQNTANTMSSNTLNGLSAAGQAQASGYMGAANALSGAGGTLANYYGQQKLLSSIGTGGFGAGSYGTPGDAYSTGLAAGELQGLGG